MAGDKLFILHIRQSGQAPRRRRLAAGIFIIGRDPDRAQVVLLSGRVSRQHATLTLAPGTLQVRDRHSKNGIYVNGIKVGGATLQPGDVLTVGDFSLTLEVAAARAAPPPTPGSERTDPDLQSPTVDPAPTRRPTPPTRPPAGRPARASSAAPAPPFKATGRAAMPTRNLTGSAASLRPQPEVAPAHAPSRRRQKPTPAPAATGGWGPPTVQSAGGLEGDWGSDWADDWRAEPPQQAEVEEENTEASFVAPYSLSSLLLRDHRGVAGSAVVAEPQDTPTCVELLVMVQAELTDFALLRPGACWQRPPRPPGSGSQAGGGRGLLRVDVERGGDCIVLSDERLRGVLVRDQVEHDVAHFFAPQNDGRFSGLLLPGDVLHLSYRHETFCLRTLQPPTPAEEAGGWARHLPGGVRSAGLSTLLTLAVLLAVPIAPPPPPPPPAPLEFVVATAKDLQLPPPRQSTRPAASLIPTPVAEVISDAPDPRPELSRTPAQKLVKQISHVVPKKPRPAPRTPHGRRAALGVVGARRKAGSTTVPGRRTAVPSVSTLQGVVSPAPQAAFKVSGLLPHPVAAPPQLGAGGAAPLPAVDPPPPPAPTNPRGRLPPPARARPLRGAGGAPPMQAPAAPQLGAGGAPDDPRHGDGPGLVQKSGSGIEVRGGALDMAAIMRVILAHTAALQACYEQGLMRNPAMAGRVRVAWIIDLSGHVGQVRVVDSALDSLADSCVVEEVRGWAFPLPHGSPVSVVFPFNTKSIEF